MKEELRVGIVGCGLIGMKRANALCGARLTWCADINAERAKAVAARGKDVRLTTDWRELVNAQDVDVVVVATTNDLLAPITLEAIRSGKDVLVEKPAARNVREAAELVAEAERLGRLVHVGFNHRYHPAFQKAFELVKEGACGELMFLRARYGHGGRVGYDKEWRADPRLSGGGELIDQGVHVIDLARWFLGEFPHVSGHASTSFWDMPVDDNAFLNLRTEKGQTAFMHVSCTEWKNLFSFEIYGKTGKLHIEGLGGSYGPERLYYYKMLPEMGPPETTIWEYVRGDSSWDVEFKEFLNDIRARRIPSANLVDALRSLEIVESVYRESGYDYHA